MRTKVKQLSLKITEITEDISKICYLVVDFEGLGF